MKVSILIPIYNSERYLYRCLRSVFEQTYSNIEYILINDCSSDSSYDITNKIISEYSHLKEHIYFYSSEKNLGISKIRNMLLDLAKGDFIYFVDSDDFIALNAVESLVKVVNETDADIVRSNYFECTDNGIKLKENIIPVNQHSYLSYAIKSTNSVDSLWKLFIRRELFVRNSLVFTSGIDACEDYIMTVKLFYYSSKIIDIQSSYYYYTIDNSNSISKNSELFNVDKINSVIEVQRFLKANSIYEQYKESLLYRMIMSKQCFLINRKFINLDLYYKYFPEANSSWRLFNFGFRERLLFWMAEHNLKSIIKLYYKISSLHL